MANNKAALIALLLGAGLLPGHAFADETNVLKPLQTCKALQDSVRRLACYDAAMPAAEALAVQLQDERKARRADEFGKRADEPRAEKANPAGSDDAVTSVSSAIQEIWTDSTRRRIFMLANGHVWRETSNSTLRGTLRPNDNVDIKRGGIGGYRMTLEGRSGFIGVARIK